MGVTRLLLLGPFYTIQIQLVVLFCTGLYINDSACWHGFSSDSVVLLSTQRMVSHSFSPPTLVLPSLYLISHLALSDGNAATATAKNNNQDGNLILPLPPNPGSAIPVPRNHSKKRHLK